MPFPLRMVPGPRASLLPDIDSKPGHNIICNKNGDIRLLLGDLWPLEEDQKDQKRMIIHDALFLLIYVLVADFYNLNCRLSGMQSGHSEHVLKQAVEEQLDLILKIEEERKILKR